MTNEGTLPHPTRTPLISPSKAPTRSPATPTTMMLMPGWSMNRRPVRYAVSPRTDPTDRSTLRVMITTASPTASSSKIEGVRSRSRQLFPLKKKLGVLTVAAAMTTTRTKRMDASRDLTMLLKARRHTVPGGSPMSATATEAPETHDALVEPSSLSPRRRAFNNIVKSREASILLVLVVVIAAATVKTPSFFFSGNSWRDLLLTPSILLLLAVGEAVVIITRNVDLSVGSVLGLTAYLTGRLFIDHPGINIMVVGVAGLLVGALLGLINGVLVGWGKVPSLVITLGTLYIYRGIVLTWAGSNRINASDMPSGFLDVGTKQILTIPVLFIVALVVLVAVGYYLHTARAGRT